MWAPEGGVCAILTTNDAGIKGDVEQKLKCHTQEILLSVISRRAYAVWVVILIEGDTRLVPYGVTLSYAEHIDIGYRACIISSSTSKILKPDSSVKCLHGETP